MSEPFSRVSSTYQISAPLKPRPYPPVSAQQRRRPADAISQLRSNKVMTPSAQRDDRVTRRSRSPDGGQDASSAADRAKEIIQRNAQMMAHPYDQDVDVVTTAVLPGPW